MRWYRRIVEKVRDRIAGERRRFPRYECGGDEDTRDFFSMRGIAAYLQDSSHAIDKPHPIINLSEGGIALFLIEGEDPASFKEHPQVILKLYIEGQLLTIPCDVAYVVEGLRRMGLKFAELTEQQREVILKFLDVHFLAASLKEIPVKEQRMKGRVCRWHHGMNNTELFSWETNDGHVLAHIFIWLNRVVEWAAPHRLDTGTVRRPDFALTRTVLYSSEPNPIDVDETVDEETVDTARRIIELAPIDPVLKQHFLDHVKVSSM